MANDGKQHYSTKFYILDAILSVGYRVNSINATAFRRWANEVLKEYLLRGYTIRQQMQAFQIQLILLPTNQKVSWAGAET